MTTSVPETHPENKPEANKLRDIPKVELHRHLDCSMRLETMKELARAQGIEVPLTEAEIKAKFLVVEPMKDLAAVLQKFLTAQQILNSPEVLTRLTRECIEDCVAEGIRILELRYAPTFIQDGHPHLSFEKIHDAILRGVAACSHLPIAVGLILIVQRTRSIAVADTLVDFAIAHRDTIVALDLADNEVGFNSIPFASCFARARNAGLHITVHAGEAPVPTASQSVRDAIDHLGAERIGHGVQIYRDPEMMEYVRTRRIALELCPTSNWLTSAVPSLSAHPFRQLMAAGVPVTVNTDDPGIFGISLLTEYRILEKHHAFSRSEFDAINDTAASASFIQLSEKQRVWPRPIKKVPG